MKNIKDVQYNFVRSIDPDFVEIVAEYPYREKMYRHYIFISKEDKLTKDDYLRKAKESFLKDIKKHHLPELHIAAKRPILITAVSVLAVSVLTGAGILTWKLLSRSTPVVSNEVEINLDPETDKNMSIEPAVAKTGEEYNGLITLKELSQVIDPSSVSITCNGKELVLGTDYTLDLKGKNADGKFEYTLNIPADKMSDDLSIKIASGDVNATKISQTQFEKSFEFTGEEFERARNFTERISFGFTEYWVSTYTKNIMYDEGFYFGIPGSKTYYSRLPNANDGEITILTNGGVRNMYNKETVYYFPTLSSYDIHQVMDDLLKAGNLRVEETGGQAINTFYDPNTLSYVYNDASGVLGFISFRVTFYDAKPTQFNFTYYSNDTLLEEHISYVYHVKEDPVLPPNTMIIDPSKTTREITEAERKELFDKIGNATNLIYSHRSVDFFVMFIPHVFIDHNKHKVITTNTLGSFTNAACYNKISDTEYEGYDYNGTSRKWTKKLNVTKEEYDTYSLETFQKVFKYVNDNDIKIGTKEGQFIFDGNTYTYTNPDQSTTTEFKAISFICEVYTSLEGNNKEILPLIIGITPPTNKEFQYTDIVINDSIHIEMPEVK